jgi:hypothetical protein
MTLLKAVLHTKHLMNQEVLGVARELVRKVVEQLMEKLARPVRSVFLGRWTGASGPHRVAKNFDAQTAIRRNLSTTIRRRAALHQTPTSFPCPSAHGQMAGHHLVDGRGMADSVIHSAATAAIFFGIKTLRTHLVLFDTSIVDVTRTRSDPSRPS